MHKVIGIIPSRYLSSRFPGKPLAPILGKTLVQRTYENALLCKALSLVVVATDDQRIFEHVKGFGGNAVMTSENCPTGTDRLAEVVKNSPFATEAELILNIQGDEPCVSPHVMAQVIQALQTSPKASVSTAITPHLSLADAENPHVVKCVVDEQGYALYFSRGLIPAGKNLKFQEGIVYYKHLGLYCYRKEFLLHYSDLSSTPLQRAEDLEQLKVLEHGFRIKTVKVNGESMDVNTPEDIKKVEHILCKQSTFLSQAESAQA